eukprot:TRINITY_DN507_c0_g1_i3.p1 TRINITY_DN507_c0_g1~~TRINITY_DN507_c0_g1_i3.p1  ORF type:complete len:912 (+),score=335.98 TRINITY_DN507_c0_g1_i3:86-2737(+)
MPEKVQRELLPNSVVPSHYDLSLDPDLVRFTYTGTVAITVDVHEPVTSITLHAKKLLFSAVKYKPAQGDAQDATVISVNVKKTTLTLGFPQQIAVGSGVLTINFQGVLNDSLAGFYRSKYKSLAGEEKYLATTQFEAIDARQCFPCWDEPSRKAVFTVTMQVPPGCTAISNMPEAISEMRKDGGRKVTFLPTPKMSTYLLAFIVGELDFVQAKTRDGVMIRAFGVPGKGAKLKYALDHAVQTLEYYNRFFGTPYPLPKLDMAAIPDFAQGAMENWGLVTYREADMLCTPTDGFLHKQRVVTVITHELAHQWFGDLVTMAWWDDLWLNEGFASYVQEMAADHIHPEWNQWEDFVCSAQTFALDQDALRSSHPIQVPMSTAEQVEEVFDAISYYKGASVVRMIHAVVGAEDFQKGLRLYFQRHQYGNTETTDLWAAWQEASGKPIPDMMQCWTEQMGYPLLTVSGDPASGKVKISQNYFVADGSVQPGDEEKQWIVPVFIGNNQSRQQVQMTGREITVDVPRDGWFKVNFEQHVPLRVQYSTDIFKRLCAAVHDLPAVDRIGLLSDSFALLKCKKMCPSLYLDLLQGFCTKDGRSETNDKVWYELGGALNRFNKYAKAIAEEKPGDASKKLSEAFNRLAAKLVTPAFEKVGWDTRPGDDDNTKGLRSTLVKLTASFSPLEPQVAKEARRRYEAFLEDINTPLVPQDNRSAILSIVVQNDGEPVFNKLKEVHNATDDSPLRISIYRAMGNGAPELKRRCFEWALTDDVRSQDIVYPIGAVAGSQSFGGGGQIAFTCIKEYYDKINERVGKVPSLWQSMVDLSGTGFLSKEKAQEVKAFWESTPQGTEKIRRVLDQLVESICTSDGLLKHVQASLEAGKLRSFCESC